MRKRKGISVVSYVLLLVMTLLLTSLFTYTRYIQEKYDEHRMAFRQELLRNHSLNFLEERFVSKEEIKPFSLETQEVAWKKLLEKEENSKTLEIEHIYGGTYEGYMMLVHDPERVFIAINPDMGSGRAAPELDDYVERLDAFGGINGGGFDDPGGVGNGSIPAGIVIMDGKVVSGGAPQPIVGITKDHKLITRTLSAQEALDLGVQQAVTFGPTFLTDGRITYIPGTDNLNMLNPRTAIGQREDGTFLLLVIDGRGPSSFGAQYEDVVQIFQDYGAVNASNLDGGNSSVMIYDGEYIHYPVSMYNSRNLPSVILVKKEDGHEEN